MGINNDKIINFSFASLRKLMEVVKIKKIKNHSKFDEWFSYNYKINEDESEFLEKLVNRHELDLSSYSEQKLTIRFIAPILNRIDFHFDDVKDWYSSEISCKLNGFLLKGKPYLIVAKGIDFPEKPYFFLQEYKKSVNPYGNPEYQVLAEMLAAITLNKSNKIYGSFVIGQYWKFVILEKLENGSYEYFISHSFDALKFSEIKKIYINLQKIKFLFCR